VNGNHCRAVSCPEPLANLRSTSDFSSNDCLHKATIMNLVIDFLHFVILIRDETWNLRKSPTAAAEPENHRMSPS
jgi:hypothetical protein